MKLISLTSRPEKKEIFCNLNLSKKELTAKLLELDFVVDREAFLFEDDA